MKAREFFIGSLPYATPQEAIDFVKTYSSHLPFLPQLPEANPQEDMIGQVLRGMELGYWDEKACSSLELFQNEFAECEEVKIQIAGPFAVARSMSTTMKEVELQWLPFWDGLNRQLEEGGFHGTLWLQIDEPFWSKTTQLPDSYADFLGAVQSMRKKIKVGLHSCATDRPVVPNSFFESCDFFSFDFLKTLVAPEELKTWEPRLKDQKQLILGILEKGKPADPRGLEFAQKHPKNVWVSPTCGLYDWSPEEITSSLKMW